MPEPLGDDARMHAGLEFVRAWRRVHVPANVGHYAIYRLPFEARADLLHSLRTALEQPDLRIYAKPNCGCMRCAELRDL